ncbi:MAG TPA: HAD-IC family P-type ATPase [Acidimicrobiales bacterium]|nr:HAD-IC family P-type ATPase [Acidimicrobiales bacterium]
MTDGLGPEEVEARILAGQVNAAPQTSGRTLAQILRANVFTRFNAILGSLFVVVAIVGPFQDGLFGIVLVANTAIGILQELRAKRTLDRLAILTAPEAHIVRGGQVTDLPPDHVVVDDVVELRPGDQIPVDGEVQTSDGLEVDESLLSGEAEPVTKRSGDPVLSGSFVVAGTGRIIATGVGEAAYATGLEARARHFRLIHSELQRGTNQILRMVTWVMVPVGGALVVSQLLRSHQTLDDALRGSVAGVAAMVPEGLVLLTSIAFATGALRLAGRRVLVQELAAIEGLARVDVLCLDKTGTLTEPGMQLDSIDLLADRERQTVEEVVGAMAGSDPAPNATMRALAAAGPPSDGWTVTTRVPFSSIRKWSAVNFAGRGTWVLGAPEMMATVLPADAQSSLVRHQAAGRRVLLLAVTADALEGTQLPTALAPVALLVLAEHLRADAVDTIRYLLDQGITVKVLSGDAPETVSSIAARVGIPSLGDACDASALGEDVPSLGAVLEQTNVFGRVRPEQKVAAVRALQAGGHVVAMVGDGVNDVQALKEADLGIAMGSGSQSSRSVARVVLLDSSFAAVPHILGEGRRVIANIERVANLFVTKTVYAALLAVVVAISAVPFPFFPRHLTIVSTLTIGIPGFFLALAPGAPRSSAGFTHRVLAFTAPAGLAAGVSTFVAYAVARVVPGTSVVQARTAAMLVLFIFGLWVLVLIAQPLDAWRIGLVTAMAGGLVLLFAFPLMRRVFSLEFPPARVALATLGAVAVGIGALTLWRRRGLLGRSRGPSSPKQATFERWEPSHEKG